MENRLLTKPREVTVEKNWVQRVLDWNPCTGFAKPDTIFVDEPSDQVYIMGDCMVAHPATVRAIKDGIIQCPSA